MPRRYGGASSIHHPFGSTRERLRTDLYGPTPLAFHLSITQKDPHQDPRWDQDEGGSHCQRLTGVLFGIVEEVGLYVEFGRSIAIKHIRHHAK